MKDKVHIFRSNDHLPTYAPNEFKRRHGEQCRKIISPLITELYGRDFYVFGEYTEQDHHETNRFNRKDIGAPYFKSLGVKHGNHPKGEYGEPAGYDCWTDVMLLPHDPSRLEARITELLAPDANDAKPIIDSNIAMVVWAYHSLVPVLERTFKNADLSVVRHYKNS